MRLIDVVKQAGIEPPQPQSDGLESGPWRCEKCGGKTCVVDSRATGQSSIRRRRKCLECGERFTTYETTKQPTNDADALTAQLKALKAAVDAACAACGLTESVDETDEHQHRD